MFNYTLKDLEKLNEELWFYQSLIVEIPILILIIHKLLNPINFQKYYNKNIPFPKLFEDKITKILISYPVIYYSINTFSRFFDGES